MTVNFTKAERVQIGRRIADARVAKRLTQAQVAEYCNCTTNHISNIECGEVGPSFPIIAKIGKLLDTGIDYYLYNLPDYYSERMISADISEALVECDSETRMFCRETILRVVEDSKSMKKRTINVNRGYTDG